MKKSVALIILIVLLTCFVALSFNYQSQSVQVDADDEYFEAKNTIIEFFDKVLSKNHHQLELGANKILFDEKTINKINLVHISDKPIERLANIDFLKEKYTHLDDVLVFEITYYVKYYDKFRNLVQRDDGEVTQYITLIKLKESNFSWLIEEIVY